MLIWGGCSPSADSFIACGKYFASGGIFDLETNNWQPVNTINAPEARTLHTAVWTGNDSPNGTRNKMIVWGGCNGGEACGNSIKTGLLYIGKPQMELSNNIRIGRRLEQEA